MDNGKTIKHNGIEYTVNPDGKLMKIKKMDSGINNVIIPHKLPPGIPITSIGKHFL